MSSVNSGEFITGRAQLLQVSVTQMCYFLLKVLRGEVTSPPRCFYLLGRSGRAHRFTVRRVAHVAMSRCKHRHPHTCPTLAQGLRQGSPCGRSRWSVPSRHSSPASRYAPCCPQCSPLHRRHHHHQGKVYARYLTFQFFPAFLHPLCASTRCVHTALRRTSSVVLACHVT